ncbi:hypothetical protein RU98_GL002192 [Enterococcus caccae]|nr:hypothetical protein RU98_GL002192 [Enterococcus caccae]
MEVKNGTLDGKYDDLRRFSGKTVNITIVPEYYSYSIPYDRSTNSPTQRYVVNNDGTIDFIKEEQTQLELDENGNVDLENQDFMVTKEIVDEFILAARSLEFPGRVNPRDVLHRLNDGESAADIAEDYEISEINLINGMENARAYYAPYADAWNKKRNEVVFEEKTEVSDEEETAEDNYSSEEQNVTEDESEGENEQSEIVTEDDDEDGEVDPY